MKRASFFGGSMRASAPLWVWAMHFAFCYVAVAIGCDAGWHRADWGGLSALRWTLASGSVVAFAAAVLLLAAARRHARDAGHDGLASRVGLLVAALSLLGIAWTSLPTLLLPACRFA